MIKTVFQVGQNDRFSLGSKHGKIYWNERSVSGSFKREFLMSNISYQIFRHLREEILIFDLWSTILNRNRILLRSFLLMWHVLLMQVHLEVAAPLDANMLSGLHLGLEGEHQYINAGLAIALCSTWLQRTGHVEINYLKEMVNDI